MVLPGEDFNRGVEFRPSIAEVPMVGRKARPLPDGRGLLFLAKGDSESTS